MILDDGRLSTNVGFADPAMQPGYWQRMDYANTRQGWKDYYALYNALERIANRQPSEMPADVRQKFESEMSQAIQGKSNHDHDAWLAVGMPWNDSHFTVGDPRNALANAWGGISNFGRTAANVAEALYILATRNPQDDMFRKDVLPNDFPERQHLFMDDNKMNVLQKIDAARRFQGAVGLPTPNIAGAPLPQRRP